MKQMTLATTGFERYTKTTLFVTCALANLFMVRGHLLRLQEA
jgi:hypothetical protein